MLFKYLHVKNDIYYYTMPNPNTCQVIITRGKNQGKACYQVNRKCRHKDMSCEKCGTVFTMETSYYRHVRTCNKSITENSKLATDETETAITAPKRKLKLTKKPPVNVETVSEDRVKIVKNIPYKQKVNTVGESVLSQNPKEYVQLLTRIQGLEKELETVKQRPTTIHQWNIVFGDNFYEQLVNRMGNEEAINFLSDMAAHGTPVDLISKLYLEGRDPADYPVACRDKDHFRYINSEKRIIDDKGGHSISKLVSAGVRDALITAANEHSAGAIEGNTDEDEEIEEITIIKDFVTNMPELMSKEAIIRKLSEITTNPNHPFFQVN